jgi:hypothetical protein
LWFQQQSGDITLKHYPATEILGDHFTKPLQGGMFMKFRAEIQGIPVDTPDSDLGWDRDELKVENTPASSTNIIPQECVGKSPNTVKPFMGYIRMDSWRECREGEGRLSPSLITSTHSRARVCYVDVLVGGCKGGFKQEGVKDGMKKARVNTPTKY